MAELLDRLIDFTLNDSVRLAEVDLDSFAEICEACILINHTTLTSFGSLWACSALADTIPKLLLLLMPLLRRRLLVVLLVAFLGFGCD